MFDLDEKFSSLLARVVGTPVWDESLCKGYFVYPNGTFEFFRYPSVLPHPDCRDPKPVTDEEFRDFIKRVNRFLNCSNELPQERG